MVFPGCSVMREGRGVLFVAAVEGVIGAFDEDFAPLDKAGGEEPGDRAKNELLDKCGVHLRPFVEQEQCHSARL